MCEKDPLPIQMSDDVTQPVFLVGPLSPCFSVADVVAAVFVPVVDVALFSSVLTPCLPSTKQIGPMNCFLDH